MNNHKKTVVEYHSEKIIETFGDLINQLSKEQKGKIQDLLKECKEMEKNQSEKYFVQGYKKKAELSGLKFDEISETTAKSLFHTEEYLKNGL